MVRPGRNRRARTPANVGSSQPRMCDILRGMSPLKRLRKPRARGRSGRYAAGRPRADAAPCLRRAPSRGRRDRAPVPAGRDAAGAAGARPRTPSRPCSPRSASRPRPASPVARCARSGWSSSPCWSGQAMLGWDNDLVDRARDERHDIPGKPIGSGLLDPGTVWFSVTCALLLVVPLSLSAGPRAGAAYLIALLIGFIGNRVPARQRAVLPAVGAAVRPLPGLPRVRRMERRRSRHPAHRGDDGAGRSARARRALPARAAGPGARQQGRPAARCRCGSRSGPAHRDCSCCRRSSRARSWWPSSSRDRRSV